MNSLDKKRRLFKTLCARVNLEPPVIRAALPSDPCDVTDIYEVRFQPHFSDWQYQTVHVFAHWLCDLHSGGYENHTKEEAERADKVADVIACLIHGYGRATTGEVLV